MRIITGKYKGRHFDIPRTFKARPTTDFAKENIFNVLTGYIDFEGAMALDLFSGTGSISLELASRGCAHVISVEADRDHHRFILQCLQKLGSQSRGQAPGAEPSEPVPMTVPVPTSWDRHSPEPCSWHEAGPKWYRRRRRGRCCSPPGNGS